MDSGWAGLVFGLIIGMLITFLLVVHDVNSNWRKETIERGLGQYCPHNGKWAWKGECDE
jgi:hypothetical protein